MALEVAIRNRQSREVEYLLARMSDEEAIGQLTSTYGQGRDRPDHNGLYQGTTPILHAARSGNIAILFSVFQAMRARLTTQQVRHTIDSEGWYRHQAHVCVYARKLVFIYETDQSHPGILFSNVICKNPPCGYS